MTDNTTTQNEMIEQIIRNEELNSFAISEAFTIITADGDIANPEILLQMAVWILLENGFEVSIDRVRMIAAKRCIGLDADEAIDVISEDDDIVLVAGRVELVNPNGEVAI